MDKEARSISSEEPSAACVEAEAPKADGAAAPEPKPARTRGFYVAVAVAVIAVAVALLLGLDTCSQERDSSRDPNAALGQLEGKTPEEIQAELDRIVQEGMFNISIASEVEFASGTSEGDLCIENVPGNRYLMQVTITRDDTDEAVFTSGIIEQNYHIQSAKLDVDLPAGEYPCTATFRALDAETEQEVGRAAAKVTIAVLS